MWSSPLMTKANANTKNAISFLNSPICNIKQSAQVEIYTTEGDSGDSKYLT